MGKNLCQCKVTKYNDVWVSGICRHPFIRYESRMDMFKSAITRNRIEPYLFVGPAMVVLAFLLIYPIFKVFGYSFHQKVFFMDNPPFVGLENFVKLFTPGSGFYPTIGHTVVFTVASVVLHISMGFIFAILLNAPINRASKNIYKVLLILPWIFTAPIVALIWRLILAPLGIVNFIGGQLFNLKAVDWYGNPNIAMFSLIVTNAWRGFPFVMVSLLAGLQSIPKTLYEAADVDGARLLSKHRHITIPLLKPLLLSITLLDTIWTFRVFPIVWLTTGGGPMGRTEMMSTSIFRQAFFKMDYGRASAEAVVILIIIAIFSIFYIKNQRSQY
jgi:multiple sugar transport system permease protein